MASGVIVSADCPTTFMKMAEGKKEYRYILFKIQDKEIVVEKAVRPEEMKAHAGDDYADNSKAAYEEFLADLKSVTDGLKDCRYAVFDFKFTGMRQGAGVSKMDKIVFLQVCPEDAHVKRKMIYASSSQAIKSALGTGKMITLQVSGESDMSHHDLLARLSEKYSDS